MHGKNLSEPSIMFSLNLPLINFTYHNTNWWLNFGANVYICFNRACYKAYQNLSRGNHFVTHVLRINEVELKVTFRKIITLKDV